MNYRQVKAYLIRQTDMEIRTAQAMNKTQETINGMIRMQQVVLETIQALEARDAEIDSLGKNDSLGSS